VNLAQAAVIYLRDQPTMDAIGKDLDEAKKTIKAHFKAKQPSVYKGITYSCSPFSALDVGLARIALGPSKTAECTVSRLRETLTLPAHLRRGAVLLGKTA
jgi:hypothetical protein